MHKEHQMLRWNPLSVIFICLFFLCHQCLSQGRPLLPASSNSFHPGSWQPWQSPLPLTCDSNAPKQREFSKQTVGQDDLDTPWWHITDGSTFLGATATPPSRMSSLRSSFITICGGAVSRGPLLLTPRSNSHLSWAVSLSSCYMCKKHLGGITVWSSGNSRHLQTLHLPQTSINIPRLHKHPQMVKICISVFLYFLSFQCAKLGLLCCLHNFQIYMYIHIIMLTSNMHSPARLSEKYPMARAFHSAIIDSDTMIISGGM